MCLGEAGVEADRLPAGGLGLREAPLPVQRVTEAGVSDGEVRVQREGRPVGGFRIGVPVRLAQAVTQA